MSHRNLASVNLMIWVFQYFCPWVVKIGSHQAEWTNNGPEDNKTLFESKKHLKKSIIVCLFCSKVFFGHPVDYSTATWHPFWYQMSPLYIYIELSNSFMNMWFKFSVIQHQKLLNIWDTSFERMILKNLIESILQIQKSWTTWHRSAGWGKLHCPNMKSGSFLGSFITYL